MKITKKFIQIAIVTMLAFSLTITPAITYRQAMTETSEKVYSIGDVSAVLNVSELANREDHVIYPTEYIPAKPYIQSTGSNSAWLILGVKIPSMNNPYCYVNESGFSNADMKDYYPAFYTVVEQTYFGEKGPKYGNLIDLQSNYAIKDNGYWNIHTEPTPDPITGLTPNSQVKQDCTDNWTFLGFNDDYACQDNGFYIYYYGLKNAASSYSTIEAPFIGLVAANFQTISFDSTKKKLNYYDDKMSEFTTNLDVEMRLFAVQAFSNASVNNVKDAFKQYQSKFSDFGTESVVSATIGNTQTKGEHPIELVVTKDVTNIKIENADTTGYDTYSLLDDSRVISVSDVDSSGFKTVKLTVDFKADGKYVAYALNSSESVSYSNPVSLGYVKVN